MKWHYPPVIFCASSTSQTVNPKTGCRVYCSNAPLTLDWVSLYLPNQFGSSVRSFPPFLRPSRPSPALSSSHPFPCLLLRLTHPSAHLLGVPFNIASYSLLTCMVAQVRSRVRDELHFWNFFFFFFRSRLAWGRPNPRSAGVPSFALCPAQLGRLLTD